MPPTSSNPVTYFARTLFRDRRQRFGIKRNDRLSHIYVIGKTGAGKSTLLETMMLQDVTRGEGFTLLDPHGDLVERIARAIPPHRRKDLIYFDVSDPDQPYGYNPLKRVAPEKRSLAASGILEVFHKTWGERAWGQRMEHILRNALLLLLDQPEATLADLLTLFRDEDFPQERHQELPQRSGSRFLAPGVSKIFPLCRRGRCANPKQGLGLSQRSNAVPRADDTEAAHPDPEIDG